MSSPRYYPLELDLRDQPVLMVGGGSIAARKLPELLACGARVTLVAPEVAATTRRLLPGLEWLERTFHSEDIHGRKLVFACTDDAAVNAHIAALCREADIPCNRADAAKTGTFIVPGVVRRGPLTLSVSTSGRMPALTRHVKRKLSALLGEEWGQLAEILAEARDRLAEPEALAYDDLAETLRRDGADAVRSIIGRAPASSRRNDRTVHPVLLVGAGPGDPSLLTLGAAEALRHAEVILHDRLASPAVLDTAPPGCLLVPVEKRGHFESHRQDHINEKLVEHARAGKRVVRLKGGDPFVFGRGFEEALALEAAGIPWRVLPGVTSSVAVPALAGIPLTHRGVARSFAVASGMAGSESNPDFPKADTLVLLMALYRLEEIVPALLRAGYTPATPAAAIQDGSLPEQRLCRTTLGELRAETARLGFDSPALIVIGEVVNLSRPQ
ncbi:MAG: uroporphyrinogen-III C-methyltransferase [Fibrobacteria bacterium]|jgi:uroporphyrin-III C-methyltransferase/precorrin-2 dehydrogenase/sirohydrochlorin ferrochelatase|nr:uroporphyrinogen-III C-methyltransferase [Fibrobacteria bacterium]